MAQLAFWPAPKVVNETATRVIVERASALAGSYVEIVTIDALDHYDNWVTHYNDPDGTTGDYYRAKYLDSNGTLLETSFPEAGQTPYNVTPQMVIDTIQGLPLNSVAALMVQLRIKWAIEWVEEQIRQKLAIKTATKEIYTRSAFQKLLGNKIGYNLQLRHFPVVSVDNIHYQIRTGANPTDQEITGLNIQLENHDPVRRLQPRRDHCVPHLCLFLWPFCWLLGTVRGCLRCGSQDHLHLRT